MGSTRDVYTRLGLAAALALAVAGLGCREPTALPPRSGLLGLGGLGLRVTGVGTIKPPGEELDFDFDVTDTPPSGRLAVTWYFSMNGGGMETFTVDPARDPATEITSVSQTSAACAQFTGTGRQDIDTGGPLYFFIVNVCDNANPGAGYDTFQLTVPPDFDRSGTLTQGDIAISTF